MSKKYQNADSTLAWDLLASSGSGSTFVLKSWEWALFPPTWDAPYDVTIEKFNSSEDVTKREILTISARSWDVLTISARASQSCVQDDTADPKTRTADAKSFNSWDRVYMSITEDDFNWLETAINTTIPNTYATKEEVAEWDLTYNASSTWNDDYQVSIPNINEYKNWMKIYVKADVANVGACTCEVNSLWAVVVKKEQWTTDLDSWDWKANWIACLVYNSTWPVWQFSSNLAIVPVSWFSSSMRANRTATQSISNSTETKVQLNVEDYDVLWEFDNTTNYRFTALATWKYQVIASVHFQTAIDQKAFSAMIKVNGTSTTYIQNQSSWTWGFNVNVNEILNLTANDYVELWCRQNSWSSINIWPILWTWATTYMSISRIQ